MTAPCWCGNWCVTANPSLTPIIRSGIAQPAEFDSALSSRRKSHLRGDQIFVDLHAQARTLRQVKIAFLVDQRGVVHDCETIGIRGDWRVVEDLNPRRVRPGGDGVELGDGAEIASAVMGNC